MSKRIFISGLTAAGKTTHSKLLCKEHQLEYISASGQLLHELNVDTTAISGDFWISDQSAKVRELRKKDKNQGR